MREMAKGKTTLTKSKCFLTPTSVYVVCVCLYALDILLRMERGRIIQKLNFFGVYIYAYLHDACSGLVRCRE